MRIMRLPWRKKSQVSAPIELFVAVIILAMTLALGLKVIGDVEEGKCIATLKTQTQQLKNAMLDVALGSSGTKRTVYFTLPSCGDKKVEGLQFVLYKKPEYCRLCPGTYGHCWQVVPVARDPRTPGKYFPVLDAISCINMAGDKPCFDDPRTPIHEESPCNSANFGVPSSILDSELSSWQTLSGVNARAFYINLTKTTTLAVGAGASGTERGSIQVCAKAA